MISPNKDSYTCSVSPDTFLKVGDLFISDPRVVDGMGDKTIIGKCRSTDNEIKIQVAEVSILEFESSSGKTKRVTLVGNSSYEIQYGIYRLNGKRRDKTRRLQI